MGAQTIRYLAQLMENGSPTEQMVAAMNPGYIPSPLFTGSDATKGSIASITSISGPHDGNTLVYLLGNQDVFGGYVSFFTALASLATTDPAIDLKLDQWGISKAPGETDVQFIIRAMTNSPLAASLDSSLVDLSPQGAAYLNSQVAAQPNVYYFSYATSDSHESGGVQVPNANMNPYLVPGSTLEGQLLGEFGTPPYLITQSWWENDGLLPTVSQNGPKVGSGDAIVDRSAMTAADCDQDGVFQPGVWNYMGKIENTDHYAVLGIRQDDPKVVAKFLRDFYLKIANTLRHLQ
jgi:triacylglycerol esterase/lipase EstA (alpha/beta hydrolase family)